MKKLLLIENLKVKVKDELILKGVNLEIDKGQIHALMGPNGSGKTTLAYTLMGHPRYQINSGKLLFFGQDLQSLSVDNRAKAGMFLAFQYPVAVEGVKVKEFLRQAYNSMYAGTAKDLDLGAFNQMLSLKLDTLKIDSGFIDRFLNVGFSGGERKKLEVLQLAVLEPKLVVLDEIDSGLDVDALRIICSGINEIRRSSPDVSFLIITHHTRILNYLKPDFVHIMQNGKIARSGNGTLAQEIEELGYL